MNWETILTSVVASGIVGFGSGWMGVKVRMAILEAKQDTTAAEVLRLRDASHKHANEIHVLMGRMNGKHK